MNSESNNNHHNNNTSSSGGGTKRGGNNKAKDWMYRLLKRSNRSSAPDSGPTMTDDAMPTCEMAPITRNSFRRSLKKMQTRVKNCVFKQQREQQQQVQEDRVLELQLEPQASSSSFEAVTEIEVPPIPPPRPPLTMHRVPIDEIQSLSRCYWYWGPMSTAEAETTLKFRPDGSFLVRDSSSASYLFSLSFRSVGKTMHARIEYSKGKYNLYGFYNDGFPTVTELIEDAVKVSENGVYCYSNNTDHFYSFAVRLTKPISRYTEVRSLKHLCKFVIRQCTNMNDIPKLPLPTVLYGYLLEAPYF